MPPRKEACTDGEIIVVECMVTDANSGQQMAHSSSAGGWLPTSESMLHTSVPRHLLWCSHCRWLFGARRDRPRGDELFELACVGSSGHGTIQASAHQCSLPACRPHHCCLALTHCWCFLSWFQVRWMSTNSLAPSTEQRKPATDPDAFERPRDCADHRMVWWVPRVDDGYQEIVCCPTTGCVLLLASTYMVPAPTAVTDSL